MRWFVAAAVILSIAAGPISAGAAELAGGETEPVLGVLGFIPQPDISICFCGSYFLATGSSSKDCYLVSNSIDFAEFVGRRILVYGKSFSGICQGTLARPCAFYDVEKIVALSSTGAADVDWGSIKMIYR